MTPTEDRALHRRRLADEVRAEALKIRSQEAFDAERSAEIEVRSLGTELARLREGDESEEELVERFHRACSMFYTAERESLRIVRLAAQRRAVPAYLSVDGGERVAR